MGRLEESVRHFYMAGVPFNWSILHEYLGLEWNFPYETYLKISHLNLSQSSEGVIGAENPR